MFEEIIEYYRPNGDKLKGFLLATVITYFFLAAIGVRFVYQLVFIIFNYYYSCRAYKRLQRHDVQGHPSKLMWDILRMYVGFLILVLVIDVIIKSIFGIE